MQVASIDDRINDLPSLTGALQCLPDADIWNLTSFLPEELLPVIYAAATATLANSGHEPFGLVGLEAMASGGIAFVGTTGEDYAQPFRNAIVIETEDPDEIVVQVNHLGQYPDEARRLRMAAQRTARDFTWQRVLDTLLRRLEFVATSQRLAQ
jgi:glycosyltransferase involved in cell wall biosynthesis